MQRDVRRELLSGKGPFLLVTFLWALAKKSDPAAQRSEAFAGLGKGRHSEIRSALWRGYFSLGLCKEK
jgi:hypothetical protein